MSHVPQPSAGGFTRRQFLKLGALGGAALALKPLSTLAAEAAPVLPVPEVWVIHDPDPARLIQAGLKVIAANGGLGLGRPVHKLALKVNAAWARTPEVGANTHPGLVDGFLAGCKAAGIPELVLPEKPCADPKDSFTMSGIAAAAAKHGAKLYALNRKEQFQAVTLPDAKRLKAALVGKDYLDADAVVNMPVAKHHGGAMLTICLKNWMGAVNDRGFWHNNDLHQCIADFATFLKPTWAIVDATRLMLDNGPQGPATRLKTPGEIIVSRSQVAADAVAATHFVADPASIPYLRIAAAMGLGVIDPGRMKIHRIEAGALL
ncbi:MAG: DUF362 domain-containing protein [Lentisphaeria bacterium]|jgi:uncharacterized protein (DUF362 family)